MRKLTLALGRALRPVAGRLLLGLALIALALNFLTFDSYNLPANSLIHRASAAVVFTGTFERVDAGLQLLSASAVPRLYVSGVNAGVGILSSNFVSQFTARNPNIPDMQRLVSCCVEWGEKANNTLQNAREAKCWFDRRRLEGPLLLITTRGHMARAMAALSGELDSRVLIPYPIDDRLAWDILSRARVMEYFKYLGTSVAVRLSVISGGHRLYGPFADACPTAN